MYLRRWYFLLAWIIHYFSLPVLLPSLFAPWRRLTDDEEILGMDLGKLFRQASFNLVSRGIGAVTRIFLFLFGVLTLIPAFVVGLIGLVFWIAIPLVGIPYFLTSDKHHLRFFKQLHLQLNSSPDKAVEILFDNPAGKFICSHLDVEPEVLKANSQKFSLNLSEFQPASMEDFITKFIDSKAWSDEQLKKLGFDFDDLILSARWWDVVYSSRLDPEDESFHLSQPGLGLELLFGYTPQLNSLSVDLAAPQSFSHHLIGRESLVNRQERELSHGGSAVLVGQPGVGKKTVILEFAKRAMSGELGTNLLYKRVLEFDYNFLLSESLDINQKKAKLSGILREATVAGNVILVIRDLHRLINSEVEGIDFTDLFEKHLEKRKLQIIAVSTTDEYERFILPISRLRKFFQPVEVVPVTKDEAMLILFEFASQIEKTRHVFFTTQSLKAMISGADRYITDTPFPEKVLELLDHVVAFVEKNQATKISSDDVNLALSELTGISLIHLTEGQKELLSDLEAILHKNLVGQDIAVTLIAQSLRARTVGTKDDRRPIGSFLFLGPTGVGKTQAAKTLASVYYGSDKYLLRFDMAEFVGSEGLTRLIGSQDKNQPGLLTAGIRNHPASLLLLDEIEKAHPEVFNILLQILEDGRLTDAKGRTASFKNTILIMTSNVGSEHIAKMGSLGFLGDNVEATKADLKEKVMEALRENFRPEFLNRIDEIVIFNYLGKPEIKRIVELELEKVIRRLADKKIEIKTTGSAKDLLAEQGFDANLGARPLKRVIQKLVLDPLALKIVAGNIKEKDEVVIDAEKDQIVFRMPSDLVHKVPWPKISSKS